MIFSLLPRVCFLTVGYFILPWVFFFCRDTCGLQIFLILKFKFWQLCLNVVEVPNKFSYFRSQRREFRFFLRLPMVTGSRLRFQHANFVECRWSREIFSEIVEPIFHLAMRQNYSLIIRVLILTAIVKYNFVYYAWRYYLKKAKDALCTKIAPSITIVAWRQRKILTLLRSVKWNEML